MSSNSPLAGLLNRKFGGGGVGYEQPLPEIVSCNYIFGFPEDNWESILNNYKAIFKCARMGFTGVNINAYSPQPNTSSFKELVEDGHIKDFDDNYFMSLFTFQSFFVKKTSYNDLFSANLLTFLITIGFFCGIKSF